MRRIKELTLSGGERLLFVVLIIGGSAALMVLLASLRKEPAQAEMSERKLEVEARSVLPEDVQVVIRGYGEAQPLDTVTVAPEVSGVVTQVHPRLEQGELIPKGEVLFQIDQRDYEAAVTQARSQVAQLEASLERLRKQQSIDTERLETIKRSRKLAEDEYQRIKTLFEQDDVGTLSGVDAAEIALNQAQDQADMLAQTVTLYPLRIAETESSLQSARAQLELAQTNLSRTVVEAPFDARLKSVQVEPGQFMRAGEPVLTLADDSVLEIQVPLDSRDARRWLRFDEEPSQNAGAWFGKLQPVTCSISWTETPDSQHWEGTLDRVIEFDAETRTLTVAVRVPGEEAAASEGRLPLVEGMFCSVDIPGSEMEDVFRLPRWAVTYEGEVFIVNDERRLGIRDVEVLRTGGEETFVRGGLTPGDQVIVTRLVDPLPNSLLEVARPEGSEAS